MKPVCGARQGHARSCYVLEFRTKARFWCRALAFDRCLASSRQAESHVDEVIGDHAQSNPSPHAALTAITAPVQAVPPLENADPAFACGSPALTFFEGSFFLMAPPLLASRVPVGHRNIFHT